MNFLIQSPHAWRGVWQRPHHLARRFARAGNAVRYVEPRYLRWLVSDRARFFQSRSERAEDGIEVRSVTLVNGERLGPVRARNLRALARALEASTAGGPRVLWLYNPHEAALAARVPHEILIYDIMDEYRGFPWSPPRIAEEEAALLARADHVFAGTGALHDAKRGLAEGRITCELSGVEAEFFARPAEARPAPAALAAIRGEFKKVIGYAGVIDLRVDQELIVESARARREWCWVLAGPVRCDVTRLRGERNIALVGEVKYGELPAWYHNFDCGAVPFVENELTRHVNPTKILEYAAAGIPILCRALPDAVRFYADGAWLYRSREEGIAMLGEILREGGAAARMARMARAAEWARERSWDAIAERMAGVVREIARKKGI